MKSNLTMKLNLTKKKVIIFISIASIIVLLIFSYFFIWGALNTKTLFSDVDSVNIINGNNGNITEITDQTVINDIASYINNIKFYSKPELGTGGYSYYMDLYSGEKAKHRLYFIENKFKVDNKFYWIKNNNKTSLDEFISSLVDTD